MDATPAQAYLNSLFVDSTPSTKLINPSKTAVSKERMLAIWMSTHADATFIYPADDDKKKILSNQKFNTNIILIGWNKLDKITCEKDMFICCQNVNRIVGQQIAIILEPTYILGEFTALIDFEPKIIFKEKGSFTVILENFKKNQTEFKMGRNVRIATIKNKSGKSDLVIKILNT
jgi:hypothetical protein